MTMVNTESENDMKHGKVSREGRTATWLQKAERLTWVRYVNTDGGHSWSRSEATTHALRESLTPVIIPVVARYRSKE